MQQNIDLSVLIYQTIKKRYSPFNYSEIDYFVKEELKKHQIDKRLIKRSTYSTNLLKILELLVQKGELIDYGGFYIPEKYQIKTTFPINSNQALTYSQFGLRRGHLPYQEDQEILIDVSTLREVTKNSLNHPIVLTGQSLNQGDYQAPDVALSEIYGFYLKFKNQNIRHELIMQHLLNYFEAKPLEDIQTGQYPNRYQITLPKTKVKKYNQ